MTNILIKKLRTIGIFLFLSSFLFSGCGIKKNPYLESESAKTNREEEEKISKIEDSDRAGRESPQAKTNREEEEKIYDIKISDKIERRIQKEVLNMPEKEVKTLWEIRRSVSGPDKNFLKLCYHPEQHDKVDFCDILSYNTKDTGEGLVFYKKLGSEFSFADLLHHVVNKKRKEGGYVVVDFSNTPSSKEGDVVEEKSVYLTLTNSHIDPVKKILSEERPK